MFPIIYNMFLQFLISINFTQQLTICFVQNVRKPSIKIQAFYFYFCFQRENLKSLFIMFQHQIQMQSQEEIMEFDTYTELPSIRELDSIDEGIKQINITEYTDSVAPFQPKIRSLKINSFIEQTSFGSTVLDQHKDAIEKTLKNFLESIKLIIKEDETILLQSDLKDNMQLLISHNILLHEKQRILFSKQLQCEELFYKILQFSVSKLSEEFAFQIIYVAYLVWEKYIQIRKKFMVEDELIFHAETFILENFYKIYLDPRIKILSGRSLSFKDQKDCDKMQKFSIILLKMFSQTFLLVIEGFAINPSTEPNLFTNNKFKMNAAPYQLYSTSSDEESDEDIQIKDKLTKKQKLEK